LEDQRVGPLRVGECHVAELDVALDVFFEAHVPLDGRLAVHQVEDSFGGSASLCHVREVNLSLSKAECREKDGKECLQCLFKGRVATADLKAHVPKCQSVDAEEDKLGESQAQSAHVGLLSGLLGRNGKLAFVQLGDRVLHAKGNDRPD